MASSHSPKDDPAACSGDPTAPFSPDFRAWIEQERRWGRRAIEEISRRRRLAEGGRHGLERFTGRMGLVELTGSIAAWTNGLRAGLLKEGREDAAEGFVSNPPFATEAEGADFELLGDYVARRVELLGELLDGTSAVPPTAD